MCKIPSDQCRATMDFAIRVPAPVYRAPEGCTSLAEVLVDFEAYLFDESGEQAAYARLHELADLRRDAELAEQMRLQAQAALAEEARLQDETGLAAAMRRVQDKMEMAHNGWLSEEESELDSDSSSSSSESSYSSDSEVAPFRPMLTKTNKPPPKPRKKSKPYDRPATPKAPPQEFVEFFTQDEDGTKSALGENEYWVHSIDWVNAPLTWNGKPIPPMPADEVLSWLKDSYDIFKEGKCKLDSCGHHQPAKSASLKNHLLAREHLNLRRKCQICHFAARDDMFKRRHKCQVQKGKNAEDIRRSPGPPVPSYTWDPSES